MKKNFYYFVNIQLTQLDGYGDMSYKTVVKTNTPKSTKQVGVDTVMNTYYNGEKDQEETVECLKEYGEITVSLGENTDAVVIPKVKKISEQEYKILKKFLS